MTDETTPTVTLPNIPEGALVQIRVHPLSTCAVRVSLNGDQLSVIGPGQGIIGLLPDSLLAPSVAVLEACPLRYITTPTNPEGPEGAPVPAEAEAPRIALV